MATTLGYLIKKLEGCDPNAPVVFDFDRLVPTEVRSYRGYYEQLAIGYTREGECTVEQLLTRLRACVGATLQGYKGGDFAMNERTEMWAAQWGSSSDTAIMGVLDEEHRVILETAYAP